MTRLPRRPFLALAALIALGGLSPAMAAPQLGEPAPAFRAQDADGKVRTLDEFRGRTVVLEWTNAGCPYVRKHYDAGAMQRLQREAKAQGAVWLTVVSSAPGMQGHLTPAGAKAWMAREKASPSAVLLDPTGVMGRSYEAKTTPHMFIIDKAGRLAYMGGIDDRPSSTPASLKGARNHVAAALTDIRAGRSVAQAATRPYGCSVKYASAD